MAGDRVLCSVEGKLPGNIDLIIRAFATQRSGYIHDLFLEWFEEYQSTIINVRILGVDKVGSAPLVFQAAHSSNCVVYHDGFRAHQVLAGNWLQRFLSWGHPERAVVSMPRSPLPDIVVKQG